MYKHSAIILDAGYNALSIIQELGRHGVPCVTMSHSRRVATFSRFARFLRCPDPSKHETQSVRFLYEYCKQQQFKPVVIPTNDTWAAAISRRRETLSPVSFLCVADWPSVEVLLSKDRFYEVGTTNCYLVPRTWKRRDLSDISNEEFPIAAKPKCKEIASDQDNDWLISNLTRLRLTVLNNKTELTHFLKSEEKLLDFLVFQEHVSGMSDRMFSVGIYANESSEILGLFTGKKVRGYPADIGDCIVGENHSVPEYVLANTRRMVSELKLSGILEFEYKQDARTDQFKMIEVNPRSWSWIGITAACGVNLPLIAYKDLIGENVYYTCSSLPDGSARYVKVLEDFINSVFRYRKDFVPWSKSAIQWWSEMKIWKQTVYAEFHARDFKVSLVAILRIVLMCVPQKIRQLVENSSTA